MKIASTALIASTCFLAASAFAPSSSFTFHGVTKVSSSSLFEAAEKRDPDLPAPLQPVIEALDPKYKCTATIGGESFVVSRTGGPTDEELSNENILKIVMIESSDIEVNTLVWKCMGYRFDTEAEEWNASECFPKWKENYPTPPDFIGMARIFTKEVDKPSMKSNQSLTRSVPSEYKQSLKTHLKPYGFKGYKYKELTPNKTRRAQCANWLLYYREALYGKTLEELIEEKRLKIEAEEAEKRRLEEENGGKPLEEEWKPPIRPLL